MALPVCGNSTSLKQAMNKAIRLGLHSGEQGAVASILRDGSQRKPSVARLSRRPHGQLHGAGVGPKHAPP